MNERLTALVERRARLVAQAASQRDELAEAAGPVRAVFSVADRGLSLAGHLKQHPLLLAGGVAAVAVLRPAFLLKWLKRGLLAWRVSLALKRKLTSL
jgi:hypothetical protein